MSGMMEHYGSDFNATGSVMSRSELEEQRRKRGECVRCGQKCFQKKLFKMIPITEHGKVENGRCLNCHPLDASAGVIPAVSRPATQADLKRFNQTQNSLRQSNHTGGRGVGVEQRRAASQTNIEQERRGSRRSAAVPSIPRSSVRSLPGTGSRSSSFEGPYPRGDRSFDGDASVVSSTSSAAFGSHVTGRSSESLQSLPLHEDQPQSDSRGMDSGITPPSGSARPPSSNRSVSSSSYYSTQRRYHPDDDHQSVDNGIDGSGRSGGFERHSMNGDDRHDSFRGHDQGMFGDEYPSEDYTGVEAEPTRRDYTNRANLDYYQRSSHDYSERSRSSEVDSRRDAQFDNYEDDNHIQNSSYESRGRRLGSSHSGGYDERSRSPYPRNDALPTGNEGKGGYRSHSVEAERNSEYHRRLQRSHSLTDSSNASYDNDIRPNNSFSDMPKGSQHNDSGHRNDEAFNASVASRELTIHSEPSMYEHEDSGSVTRDDFALLESLKDASNDYVEILNIMRSWPDSPHVQALGMQLLSNLQLTEEDCNNLANMGAVQIITLGMMAYPDIVDLQISGCRAMWNASFTTMNQIAFVECGALDILLKGMSSFSMQADLQEQALSVLANLGAAEQNLDTILEKGCVAQIVDVMQKQISRATVEIRGCLALANLASHQSPFKQKILQEGAGSAIVISMVMHPINPELQEKALRALRNLSANCDENRIELTNIGGIDAIVSAMQVHRDAAGVQEAGAWTLSNLAGNVDSRVLIGDCGGVDVTVRAMWVHPDKGSIQEWCCRALFALSLEQRNRLIILDVGGISAVVNAMQAHNDSPAIQEMGCAVLFNLAFDQPSKMRIVDEEALDAVVLAMVLHSDDEKVQERACQLLLQLSIVENFKAMQASNVSELVRVAARKFPDACGEPAGRLTDIIEGYISEYA